MAIVPIPFGGGSPASKEVAVINTGEDGERVTEEEEKEEGTTTAAAAPVVDARGLSTRTPCIAAPSPSSLVRFHVVFAKGSMAVLHALVCLRRGEVVVAPGVEKEEEGGTALDSEATPSAPVHRRLEGRSERGGGGGLVLVLLQLRIL